MLQTLCDAWRDRKTGKPRFWLHAYTDLIQSSLMERFYMLRDGAFQRPLMIHTVALAVVLSLLGSAAAFVTAQMMRRGADQPQIDMVSWYAGEIAAGEAPDNVIPSGYVDFERSLQPAIIFYDDSGKPAMGTGYLDQNLPVLPSGVLEHIRRQGYEKVTWEPQAGVRLASVIQRINGAHPGFLLAARSLRPVEQQKTILWRMAFGLWLTVMLLLLGGASLLKRAHKEHSANSIPRQVGTGQQSSPTHSSLP